MQKNEQAMILENKTIIITGGSGGLGSALSVSLAKEGAKVIVLYKTRKETTEGIVKTIKEMGGQSRAIQVDVSNSDSVEKMVDDVITSFGSIDILINGAGITRNRISWKMSNADWTSTLNTNLTGVFQCTKAVLPIMRNQKWGRIINITSIVGQTGVAGTSAYAASKAGIIGLTKCLAVEVASKNITANAIALGYFDAGIISEVPVDKLEKIIASIPVGRLGRVDELSHVVKFLCADESAYITGQTINVNGGLYLG